MAPTAPPVPATEPVPVHIPDEVLEKLKVTELKAELARRDVYHPSKFRKQELLELLRASLQKPVVKTAIAAMPKHSSTFKWDKNHPLWKLLYQEIKAGNIPLDADEMGPTAVYQRYHNTFEFQMEDMDFDTFISRLSDLRKKIENEEPLLPWNENHPARMLLFNEIAKGAIPLDKEAMGPAEVYCTYAHTIEFNMRGMEYSKKFDDRLDGLRVIVKECNNRAAKDEAALRAALKHHPPPELNHRGQPQWNGSMAQALLKMDMDAGRHKRQVFDKKIGDYRKIRPSELWAERREYMETLTKSQFRWKIRQVIQTEKYLHTLKWRADEKLRANMPKHLQKSLNLEPKAQEEEACLSTCSSLTTL